MRKLLLQETSFQEKFNKIDVSPANGIGKIEFIEMKMLEALNDKNPRLNIAEIEYLDVKDKFPNFIGGKFSAVIVEETLENQSNAKNDESRYFTNLNGEKICQRIMAYVFTSPATKNEGRNITATQDIFPDLIDYLSKYIGSPSYTYANHPFCYISLMSPGTGLQASILENYVRLNLLKIEFIELFPSGVNYSDIPCDVLGVLNFMANLPGSRKTLCDIMNTEDYEFNIDEKRLTIFSSSLRADLLNNDFGSRVKSASNGRMADFNGSEEKFYWLDVLSMFELAKKNKYEIDYSKLWDWYQKNEQNSSFGSSKKFLRFKSLLDYFDKKTLKV